MFQLLLHMLRKLFVPCVFEISVLPLMQTLWTTVLRLFFVGFVGVVIPLPYLFVLPDMAHSAALSEPSGCKAYLTVQSRGCSVSHYWRCNSDPKGIRWGMHIGEDGMAFLTVLDNEYRWLERRILGYEDIILETLITPEKDPASITELLTQGRDNFDFQLQIQSTLNPDLKIKRLHQGVDELTNESVVIDSELLLITRFVYQYKDLAEDGESGFVSGQQYVSENWRLFFGGKEKHNANGKVTFSDHSPVQFIEPGESGFLADMPIFDCGTVQS